MSERTQGQRLNPSSTKEMICSSTAQVGDPVYLSITMVNKVLVAQTNTTPRPVIGIILKKINSTKCIVLFRGFMTLTAPIGRIYISPTGTYTNTPPTTGYLQPIGWSFGDGTLDVNPEPRVKRS